jgi:uncharacterized membrane protein YkgB
MVLIFLLFGYQKWWEYEVQTLVPFISSQDTVRWAGRNGHLGGAPCHGVK